METRGQAAGVFPPAIVWVLGIQFQSSVSVICALTLHPSQPQYKFNFNEQERTYKDALGFGQKEHPEEDVLYAAIVFPSTDWDSLSGTF